MNACLWPPLRFPPPAGRTGFKSGTPLWRILGLLGCVFGISSAAQFGNFTYTDNGASVTITGYLSSPSGPVAIPSTIYGKPVIEIGNDAFKGRTGITAVSFSGNLTRIGLRAFQGCTSLGTITLPFGINRIETALFSGCVSLRSVTVPAGVTSIGDSSFSECKTLSSLNIPTGVTAIGSLAFDGCEALGSLSFPASLTSLGTSALFGAGLKSISVASENPSFSSNNGVLFNKSQSTLVRYPPKKIGSSYAIPASVTHIGPEAFQSCQYLTNVALPSGITEIGAGGFAACTRLIGINIPQGINSIPYQAFFGCASLSSISIPSGVTWINYFAFEGCTDLANVSLPESLETIADDAFKGCGLTGIHIPASVTSLGFEPFLECDRLTAISVDTNNSNFSSVGGVLFNKNQTTLRKYPGARSGPYRIPVGVNAIGTSAFEGTAGLTEIIMPSTLSSIGSEAFSGCSGLTRATIPASVTTLGPNAFDFCYSLKQAVFQGNAPDVSLSPFSGAGTGFFVGYYNNRTGFSSPTWQGYPSVNLGDWIDSPQDLKVEEPPGGELVNGGMVSGLGSASIGSSTSVLLTLSNAGTSDLTGLAISKSGAHAASFQISALETDYLVGGDSTTFQITFTPKGLGAHTAIIQIASSDEDENPFELTLAGTGTTPEISIEQPVGKLVADGGSRNFGSITVGGHSKLAFTIRNTGSEDLTGLGVSLAGTHKADFTVSKFPMAPVPAGDDTSFTIDFTPSGDGPRSAVIRVASNDSNESPYDITLTGKGVAVPEISIDQPVGSKLADGVSKKSFGTVKVGMTGKAKTFIIKNTGTAKLTGLSLSRNGKHDKDFMVTGLSQTSVAPGNSTTFKVAFKPTAKGTRSAAIHLRSNDADESPFDIQLTGMGSTR